jgi:hypothetical protein
MLVKVQKELREGQKSNNDSETPFMKMLFYRVCKKTIINEELRQSAQT